MRSVYATGQPLLNLEGVSREIDLMKDHRGLKMSKADISSFSSKMEQSFELSEKDVSLTAEPRVRVSKNKIVVTSLILSQE